MHECSNLMATSKLIIFKVTIVLIVVQSLIVQHLISRGKLSVDPTTAENIYCKLSINIYTLGY